MKKYRIDLTEKLTLKTFVEIEVSESAWDEFMDSDYEGIIDACLEEAENTRDFVERLCSNDIKIIRYNYDYNPVEVDELVYEDYEISED